MVMAQLTALSLPIPEDPGSKRDIGIFNEHFNFSVYVEKRKIKKKRTGKAHISSQCVVVISTYKHFDYALIVSNFTLSSLFVVIKVIYPALV